MGLEEKADLKKQLSNCMAYVDLIHSLPSTVLLDLHKVIDYELKDRKYLKEKSWLRRMFKKVEYGAWIVSPSLSNNKKLSFEDDNSFKEISCINYNLWEKFY